MAWRWTAVLAAAFMLAEPAAAADPPKADLPVVDGPRLNWKVGLWGRPRAVTAHAEALKRVVEARTGGKWTITLGYDAFGSAKELPDLVKVGALQATWVFPGFYPDRFPVYSLFDLPALPLGDVETFIKAHQAVDKHPAAIAEAARWGGTILVSGPLPPYAVMGRGKAPLTLADWKGIRIRAPGGLGDAMRRIGAVPTSMESTEVYTSLERGAIDAAALPSTVSFAAFRIQEVTKWITENLDLGAGAAPLMVNSEALAKLPPAYAALIDEVREAAYADFKTQFKETDDKNLPAWKARGIQFIRYDEATLAKFRDEAGKPVWDEWVQKQTAAGLPARELLDLVLKTARGS